MDHIEQRIDSQYFRRLRVAATRARLLVQALRKGAPDAQIKALVDLTDSAVRSVSLSETELKIPPAQTGTLQR